jgi:hypothetical protein
MAQTMGQHYDICEDAATLEKWEMEDATAPDSPGGVLITEREFLKIQRVRRLRMKAEKSLESVHLGQKIIKNGYDAPSVVREIRELFPNRDDVA